MSRELARKLRQNMTGPERKLWRLLRELKPLGYHFRRQVPIGRYYADFACHHANLIIEVDGETHGDALAQAYDAMRDEFLHEEGYDVMRLTNDDVVNNWDGMTSALEQVLATRPKLVGDTPTPALPTRGRGPAGDDGEIEGKS